MTNVNIKKLNEGAILPTYGSEYAAGADLYACTDGPVVIAAGKSVLIHTGIALELPVGYAGLIYARSGLATKRGLAPANKVGVVDCDYRGEVMVCLHNHSDIEFHPEINISLLFYVLPKDILPLLRCVCV